MAVVNPNAAGIDVGDTIHAVAVPPNRDEKAVRLFGTMNSDLESIVKWLQECGITTIAMESTGIYWKALFNYLIRFGFEVLLVNAKHVRNVRGKKTDEGDAEWIQKLHSCGLLKSSYLPGDEQETLRTLVRYRKTLTQECSRHVLRMQKALELMNIKLHTVISELQGKTGTAIIEAIIGGEREASNFVPLINCNIRASHETVVKSLQGNWREEQLFLLEENYSTYKYFKERIVNCDKAIEDALKIYCAYVSTVNEKTATVKKLKTEDKKKKNRNTPKFDVRNYLQQTLGVDVISIPGLSEVSALEIFAETGTDMSKWPSVKHFVSWLNLCPNNKISGGKLISSMVMKKKPNSASLAFRMSANGIQRSDNWLGDFFRRMKAKGGNKYAIVATANKMATMYYKMVSTQMEFKPIDMKQYQERRNSTKIAYLERKLDALKKQCA